MAKPQAITLCWCARVGNDNWRYFPCLTEKVHGVEQARHGWVRDKGELVEYPIGRYVLRSYKDGRRVYTPVEKDNPRDAVIARDVARRVAEIKGAPRKQVNPLAVLRSASTSYLTFLTKNKRHEARAQAKLVLDEFLPLCMGVVLVRSITQAMVIEFHSVLRARGCSERTVANKHQRLKSFLRFCKIDTSFMPPVPRYERKLPTIYSPAQIAAIFEAADDYQSLVLRMAQMLGLRRDEIIYAEWPDVDFDAKVYRVQAHQRREWSYFPKDGEQREIPIPDDLLDRLKARRESRPNSVLIVGTDGDRPNKHLLRVLKRLARRAGLNCNQCDGCNSTANECREFTLHRFRRTYLTTLLRNGFDLKTVQHYAGHSDLASTMRYLRPASASEVQQKINSIEW